MAPIGVSILQKVRALLDEHGYREPLPPEGVPLAHRLLNELLTKNKQLKEAVSSLKECKEKCEALNVSVEPYKEENGRLLTKLNQLHMENLKLREHNEKLAKDKENATRQLESDKKDLEFVVGELKRRISSIEEESSKKSDKILLLQEKNLKAVVVTPGGTKKPIAFQKQRMEISSHLSKMSANSNQCPSCGCGNESIRYKNNDLYFADLLRMSERKLILIQREVETHRQNAIHWEDTCSELKRKIENRDKEISRLQMLLEGGRPISAVIEDNKIMLLHSQLHQLKLENDLLSKTNTKMDLKLKSLLGDAHEAMNIAMAMGDENKDLTAELQNVTSTNRILKKDCNNTKETLSMKLARKKEMLKDCEGDLVEQHSLYHVTRDERDELKRELSHLSHIYSCLKDQMIILQDEVKHGKEGNSILKEERHRLEEILARGQGERKTMADRINTLTVQLQELEMERLSLQSEVSALRSTIGTLEKAKTESDTGQKFFKSELEKVGGQKRDLELEKATLRGELLKLQEAKEKIEEEKLYYQEQAKELDEQKTSAEQARDYFNNDVTKFKDKLSDLQQQEQKLKNRLSELSDEKETISKERDHYNGQVVQLLDILKLKPSSSSSQISRSKLKPEEELPKVLYERDVLKQELNFYKTQLRSLQNQVQRLKRINDDGKTTSPTVETDRREKGGSTVSQPHTTREATEDLETLKEERNFLRDQMEHFQHLYNEAKMKLLQWRGANGGGGAVPQTGGGRSRGSPAASPVAELISGGKESAELRLVRNELRVCDQEKEFFKEQYERLKLSLSKPLSPSATDIADVDGLIRERNVLIEERDFYKTQYDDLSGKITEAALRPSSGTVSDGRKQDLENLLAEKRALALAKAQLEAQLMNLRDDMSELERENKEINSAKKEMARSIENLQNATVQKLPPSMQNFIGEIRKSRDSALEEVERLKQDREALRNKIKNLSAQQIKDRSTAQEDFAALQLRKDECETESADYEQRLKAQATLIVSLQNQTKTLQEALQQAHTELGMSSKQADLIKKQLVHKVGEADNQMQELEVRSNQLATALSKIHDLESEVADLQQDVARLEAEGKILRGNLGKIDSDKDALNTELDSKSEFIATIKVELKKRSAEIAGLEAQVAKMQSRIDSCEMTIETEQRKVAEESQRCDRFQQDLAVATEQKEAANREIRRLQREVIGLTDDVKELQAELERTKACRENFKRKAQEYCRTLEHLSTAITNKDQEQDELVQQYLSLNETISSLKSLNATLEETASHKTVEINKMEEMLQTFKSEREYLVGQVNEALSTIEDLEAKCHHLEEEKFNLERDLLTNKDLAQKVEMRRSEVDSEARRLGQALEQLLEEKRNLERQLESASAQLSSERNAVRSLEEVLSEKRKNEFLADSSIKQLEVEKNQLQRKLSELNAELESESSEAKRLRSRSSTMELDLERAKRQLTNEQYERERAEQELRRVRKYNSMRGALEILDECGTGTERKVPARLSPSAPTSYSPSSFEAADIPKTASPISAFSLADSNGVSRQPLERVFSPSGVESSRIPQSVQYDSPKENVFGEGRRDSWKLGLGDERRIGEFGTTTVIDSSKIAGSEEPPLTLSNGFSATTTEHITPRSTYITQLRSHGSPITPHSANLSSYPYSQHMTPTSTHTTHEKARSESPSTYRVSSTRPKSKLIAQSSSTSIGTPPEAQVSLQQHISSSDSSSSHTGSRSRDRSNSNSQTLTLSNFSSQSNSHSHLTSHSHSPFHSASHFTAGQQQMPFTTLKSNSLPQTPLHSSLSTKPSDVSHSLQNLQAFIKPSMVPPKTFYSMVPDIPIYQRVETLDKNVDSHTAESPPAARSLS